MKKTAGMMKDEILLRKLETSKGGKKKSIPGGANLAPPQATTKQQSVQKLEG